jgi:hypothetical protein
MSKHRWVVLNGDAVTKSQRRYTRDEVEQRIAKALRAAGVAPASIRPTVERLLPGKTTKVAKTATQITRERGECQHALEADMERERVERMRKTEQRRLDLERSATRSADPARAAVTFVDGVEETSRDVDGPVTRLDLSQPVTKHQRRGLFGEIVDADPTEPFRG